MLSISHTSNRHILTLHKYTMLKPSVFSLTLVLLINLNAVSCLNVREKLAEEVKYIRCQRGKTFEGQLLDSVTRRSSLECLAECSHTARCMAVNVCPAGQGGLVDCGLLSQLNREQCGDLQDASHASCFYAQKVNDTITDRLLD